MKVVHPIVPGVAAGRDADVFGNDAAAVEAGNKWLRLGQLPRQLFGEQRRIRKHPFSLARIQRNN